MELDNGARPAIEFLADLERTDRAAHRSLVKRYELHAARGPSSNKQHERHIVTRGNLFEFKTRQGARLCYFNRPGNIIVLANGFRKGDLEENAWDAAVAMRDAIPD